MTNPAVSYRYWVMNPLLGLGHGFNDMVSKIPLLLLVRPVRSSASVL